MTEPKGVIVITGAGRGIGAATAKLAAARYDVCVNYRNDRDSAEAVVEAIEREGGRALAVRADVTVEDDIVRLFVTVDRDLGRVTALVNNAGILERHTRVEEMDAGRLTRVLAANVTGPFICAREAVRRMSTRYGGSGGAIVNISSIASRLGSPNEYVDYAASKAALDALTIGLAKEVAEDGIRVNSISPGVVYTELHASGGEPARVDRVKESVPMKRGGQPIEVARAVLWMLSEEASYVTGSVLEVSGGR